MLNAKPVKLIAFLVIAALMLILPLALQATGTAQGEEVSRLAVKLLLKRFA